MDVRRLGSLATVAVLTVGGAGCGSSDEPEDEPGPVFAEDLEGGLGQWVGRPTTGHHAQIVQDPLDPGNRAVNFTRTVAAGDLFSLPIPVELGASYRLTFDYLGVPGPGSLANNLGGFLGIAQDLPGNHIWLYGSAANAAEHLYDLVEDGTWHSYSVTFVPSDLINVSGGSIRITIEDGEGVGSLPEDAFFDNLRLFTERSQP